LAIIAQPASAPADPLDPVTFAVRGSTSVTIFDSSAFPPLIEEDRTSVDEIFDADTLPLIASSLTGSGAADGYSGSASTLVTDAVIGVFATATSAGSQNVSVNGSAGSGYIDYFTVSLPAGSLVPMLFTLDPSYTITTTGGACATVSAFVQVAGGGSAIPGIGSLQYVDSSCNPDALLTSIELMVPTGVPFRVLSEMSASIFFASGQSGTGTVDALNSLRLFADPVGNYAYETMSGNSFLSAPAAVPEPATLFMLGSGLACLEYRRRRT
jgi:hypothetical protein